MIGFGSIGGLPIASSADEPSELTGPTFQRVPRQREYLFVGAPYDQSASDLTTVYLSTSGYTSLGDGGGADFGIPDWQHFHGDVLGPGNTKLDFVASGRWQPTAQRGFGILRVGNPRRVHDGLRRLRWERRAMRGYVGERGWWESLSGFQQFLDVLVDRQPDATRDELTFSFLDHRRALDVEINERAFRGFGNALRHDGVVDFASTGDHLSVAADQSCFLLVRWKARSITGNQALAGKKNTAATAADAGYWLRQEGAAVVAYVSDGVDQVSATTAATVAVGTIYTALLVVDRSAAALRLYLDGALAQTTSASAVGSLANATLFRWGTHATGAGDLLGDLAEVAFGYRVPTVAELTAWVTRPLDADLDDCTLWPIDEGAGATAFATGPYPWTEQLDSDGVDDQISFGDVLNITTGDFTAEWWGVPDGATGTLFGRKNATGLAAGWMLNLDSGGLLIARISDGTTQKFSATAAAASVGRRYHLAMVVNRSSQLMTLYVDGVAMTSADVSAVGSLSNAQTCYAGRTGAGIGFFNGRTAGLRFWSLARTPAQVVEGMTQRYVAGTAGLELQTPVDEGAGTSVADDSGNGRTGTVTGAIWTDLHAEITGATWVGSGEGDASLRGLRRRRVWGQRRQVLGDLVDRQRNVFEVAYDPADFGAAGAEIEVAPFVNGNPAALTFDTVETDIYAVAPAADHYTVETANGRVLVRIGGDTPQEQRISFDVRVGPANAALAMQSVAEEAGVDPITGMDTFALGVVQLARTGAVGWATGREPVLASAVLSRFCLTIDAYWFFGLRVALFTVQLRKLPTSPSFAIDEHNVRGEPRLRGKSSPPAKQIRVLWQEHAAVFDEPDIAGAVVGDDRAALRQPWRAWETPLDTTVETEHLDSEVLEIESLYDTEADARAEAERRLPIDSQRHEVWEVDLVEGIFEHAIGQEGTLALPMLDLDAGRDFVIGGLVESQEDDQVTLILWGPEAPV